MTFFNVMFSETSKNAAKDIITDIYVFGAAFAARINRYAIYSADIIYYTTGSRFLKAYHVAFLPQL